jgi:DNA polymerase-3 subunit epsilon/oligoribonuclease
VLGIFLDTETNGLNPFRHKIIEIAFQILDLETGSLIDQYEAVQFQTQEEWQNSDLDSLQINGFNWEQVSFGIPKEMLEKQIKDCFIKNQIQRGSSVFICQNPSFDRAFFAQIIDTQIQEQLLWPYHWLDLASMHWAASLIKKRTMSVPYPWETGFTKDKIAQNYQIPPESKPHRAMNGVKHLIRCYEAVVGFPLKKLKK